MYLSFTQPSAARLGGMHAVLGAYAGFHGLNCQRSATHVQPRRCTHRVAAARPSERILSEYTASMGGQFATKCSQNDVALAASQGEAEDVSDRSANDTNSVSTLTASRQPLSGLVDTMSAVSIDASAVTFDASHNSRGSRGLVGERGLLGASTSGADGVGRQLTTSQICKAVGRDLSQVAPRCCVSPIASAETEESGPAKTPGVRNDSVMQ